MSDEEFQERLAQLESLVEDQQATIERQRKRIETLEFEGTNGTIYTTVVIDRQAVWGRCRQTARRLRIAADPPVKQ